MRQLLLVAVLAALVGCSADEQRDSAATSTAAAATTTTGSGDRGILDQLAELVGADSRSRCASRVADDSPSTAGGKTVETVAEDVESLRGLRFRRPPRPRYLTGAALDRRITALLEEYPKDEVAADGRSLVALGALPPSSDYGALVRQALTGQVAGFYDPRSGELVVDAGKDRDLGGIDRMVLAHELEHALVDQALRLPEAVRGAAPPEGREDAGLAATALVEGDATVVMDVYALQHLSLVDAIRAIAPALASERQLRGLPFVIRASMLFPYEAGARFVCELRERGGWKSVDEAYRRPPRSSAEILFPERFGRGPGPVDPSDPPEPGPGWRRIDRQAFGAADLLWLFEAPGGDEDRALSGARDRVAAWAGGELRTWANGSMTAVALRLVDRGPGGRLCASVREWRAAARLDARISCPGREVRVGISRDERTAARLVSS